MRKPTYQYFSLAEYQRRMDALRSRMEDRRVDVLLVHTPENLYYLTGYQTPGYYWYQTLVVPMDRDPVFITRLQEAANIEPLTWVEESRPYEDNDDWVAKTKDVLADLGLGSKSIGLENDSWFLTSRDHMRLTAMLPDARFVDCSGLVEQGRMIKSPQEIEYIRMAAQSAEAAMTAAIDATVVGATENEVAAEAHRAQILAGSEYTGLPLFIASGARSEMNHVTWYRKRLEPNEAMLYELVGCMHRYHAALFRPVYLGDPPAEIVRGAETTIRTLEEAKSTIRPGLKAGDVHEIVQERLVGGLGLKKYTGRVGYSIGIGFAPDWGEGHIISFFMGDERPLQAGMTFHLLVMARIPGFGPTPCSDTILVTDDGCETLTDGVERKLFVK